MPNTLGSRQPDFPQDSVGAQPPTAPETFDEVRSRNFKIDADRLPAIHAREHAVRPYPGEGYDFLAINTPSTYQQGLIPDGEESPHGLLRTVVAANHLHETMPAYPRLNAGLLDAHRLRLQPEQIISQILRTGTQVVGLNPTSINVPEAQIIAELCDIAGIPYILGGIHATLDPSIARQDFPNAAAIVRGTGELTIGPLIKAILRGDQPSLRGVYWRDSDHTKLSRTTDLDPSRLPLVRQDVYVEEPVYRHDVVIDGSKRTIDEANLFVTYGCPFECTFCSSPVLVGRNERSGRPAYRRPDMDRILDDIQHVVEDLGATAIHFLDDMAFVTEEHINELHAGLQRRNLMGKFMWRALTRAPVINRLSDDAIRKMRETGVWKIALGVESGSDEVLKGIKKKIKVDDVERAVKRLADAGIQSKGFFIFGFPGETLQQMEETRGLIRRLGRLGMTEISAFQFKPYPGTEAYAELERTRPEILQHLSYLRRTGQAGDGTKAQARATDTPWLPDDVQIAAVPSWIVRQQVVGALSDFYGTLPDDVSSCAN